jgi:hypothetical protein
MAAVDASPIVKSVAKAARGDLSFRAFFWKAVEVDSPSSFEPYHCLEEFTRLGFRLSGQSRSGLSSWRLTSANTGGTLCGHYPDELIVPEVCVTDPSLLRESALYPQSRNSSHRTIVFNLVRLNLFFQSISCRQVPTDSMGQLAL